MNPNNPILNSPYLEPTLHYNTDSEGNLDYSSIVQGRRIFKPDAAVIPSRQTGQKEVFEWNDDAEHYGTHLINLCRKEVSKWRSENYPNTTRVSKELLIFWFNNPERLVTKRQV
jgi:type III restriction enzyme